MADDRPKRSRRRIGPDGPGPSPTPQPRLSPRGNPVERSRRPKSSGSRTSTDPQDSTPTSDPGPSGRPLAELCGTTNDRLKHRWRLYAEHLEVDGRWWRLSPATTVGIDCREPVVIEQTSWEESEDGRFNWPMALGVLQETGSWNDAGLAGWALADTVVEQVVRPDPHPGYVSLFVHGLVPGTAEGTSASFVQRSMDCQCREARLFARALEKAIERL